jgi:hypothetical protein
MAPCNIVPLRDSPFNMVGGLKAEGLERELGPLTVPEG